MEDFVRDLRASVRTLARKPGFTIIVVLLLAVGIAANTAIFSVINGVLLGPLPYHEDRLVTVWQTAPKRGVDREATSPADFFDWQEQTQSFEEFGMAEPWGHLMTGDLEPEAMKTWIVTPGFFEALGTQPLLGRTFLPEEYEPGAAPVIIVSYKWWQSHYSGDRSLVGRKLILDNQATTVVGVMPLEFEYPPGRDVWGPRPRRSNDRINRGRTFIFVVGRLKADRTPAQAEQEMNAIASRLADEYPQSNAGIGIEPKPEFYVSYSSSMGYATTMAYFVRTASDPLSLLPSVKAKIREVNSQGALYGVATIDQLVAKSLNQRRFTLLLLMSFAVLALVLAGVGLYGLISFITAQGTYEIGIRMAFGADRSDVMILIIGQGMALTLTGVAIGFLASLALTRLLQKLLFGISATDPMTFVAIAVLLSAVPFLACYMPARRATKVDPMVALRYE